MVIYVILYGIIPLTERSGNDRNTGDTQLLLTSNVLVVVTLPLDSASARTAKHFRLLCLRGVALPAASCEVLQGAIALRASVLNGHFEHAAIAMESVLRLARWSLPIVRASSFQKHETLQVSASDFVDKMRSAMVFRGQSSSPSEKMLIL